MTTTFTVTDEISDEVVQAIEDAGYDVTFEYGPMVDYRVTDSETA